ncbi:MAG: hypothetical protein IJ572_02585 [Bacilli bacterium]|nr:hypothetical protein [Bacilli bacterium]
MQNISKNDLVNIHSMLLTALRLNKIDLINIGSSVDNKISLYKCDELWNITYLDKNMKKMRIVVYDSDTACLVIFKLICMNNDEELLAIDYYNKYLSLNIPASELDEYVNYHENLSLKNKRSL